MGVRMRKSDLIERDVFLTASRAASWRPIALTGLPPDRIAKIDGVSGVLKPNGDCVVPLAACAAQVHERFFACGRNSDYVATDHCTFTLMPK
jgi:hypothetical protein